MHCAPTPASRGAARKVAAAILAAFFVISAARSQNATDDDLNSVRDEIRKLRTRLDSVRQQTRSAEVELQAVELELDIRTRELSIATEMQARLEIERSALENQVAELEPRLASREEFLSRRLAALYRGGNLSYLRLMLSADARADPMRAASMLTFLITRDARAVESYRMERAQLVRRRTDVADRQSRLEVMKRVVEDRQRAVAASHSERERLLRQLRREEKGSSAHLAELEEKARRLERLIEVLSRQQSGETITADIRSFQGALQWPVRGKVVETFGRQRDPKFNTFTVNNGIKIATEPGREVRAVFQGTVLFSQWFKGYGNLIILDHGHRVFSLYGNVKGPLVTVSGRVQAGQTIAGVGESEENPPGHLYFEIRNENKPENPQKWLR